MKKKQEVCHVLNFANGMGGDIDNPVYQNLQKCRLDFEKRKQAFVKIGMIQAEDEIRHIADMSYTVTDWKRYKQCYTVSQELADDLFQMNDLTFPLDLLRLPFPTIYLDFENLDIPMIDGAKPLGVFVTISEVPFGDMVASMCSIVTLCLLEEQYVFGGLCFDYYPENMEQSLEETIKILTKSNPSSREIIKNALLFCAYLSSEEPDVIENEKQAAIYKPSKKVRYGSIRKWEVGVRYAKEYRKRRQDTESEMSEEKAGASHQSPRPHIRRAHWHVYRIGKGRKEKKVIWLPPIAVGIGKEKEQPVVIRKIQED